MLRKYQKSKDIELKFKAKLCIQIIMKRAKTCTTAFKDYYVNSEYNFN